MKKQSNTCMKPVRRILSICLVLFMMLSLLPGMAAAENWKLEDARSMLKLLNNFRTGNNTWHWNPDNTTWTTVTGLRKLSYDYELEKVAKVRAAEQAQRFGHTRPDGSKWSTAFPTGNYRKGENIAAGYDTAAAAFQGLLEEDEDYAGQGHRRNMLRNDYTRVGIAGVEINGEVYWVQEFASGAVVSSSPQENAAGGWVEEGGLYYYQKADGSWAKGWLQDGKNWYYMNEHAVMQTGWQKISGKWYHFANSGAMETGWLQDGGAWYHTNSKGAIQTGWQEIGGQWYYFRSSGEMVTGTVTIDGQREYFGGDGAWQGSEISGYDTPLGGNDLIRLLRNLLQMLREVAGF